MTVYIGNSTPKFAEIEFRYRGGINRGPEIAPGGQLKVVDDGLFQQLASQHPEIVPASSAPAAFSGLMHATSSIAASKPGPVGWPAWQGSSLPQRVTSWP